MSSSDWNETALSIVKTMVQDKYLDEPDRQYKTPENPCQDYDRVETWARHVVPHLYDTEEEQVWENYDTLAEWVRRKEDTLEEILAHLPATEMTIYDSISETLGAEYELYKQEKMEETLKTTEPFVPDWYKPCIDGISFPLELGLYLLRSMFELERQGSTYKDSINTTESYQAAERWAKDRLKETFDDNDVASFAQTCRSYRR